MEEKPYWIRSRSSKFNNQDPTRCLPKKERLLLGGKWEREKKSTGLMTRDCRKSSSSPAFCATEQPREANVECVMEIEEGKEKERVRRKARMGDSRRSKG